MRYFKLILAYDGTDFAGWQVQPGKRTVQATLEAALAAIMGEEVRAIASGRTDAGVHALGQAVSFRAETRLAPEMLCRALNGNLARDLYVFEVREMPEGFHAIRDAVAKRYRYVIQDGPAPDIFARQYVWRIPQMLNCEAMQAASQLLLGTHDFSSFEAAGAPRKSSVRTVNDIFVRRESSPHAPREERQNPGNESNGIPVTEALASRSEAATLNASRSEVASFGRIVLEIAADGFLYNMVRNITGALVEVGRGVQRAEWIAEVLAAKNRQVRYPTAPPQGLFLVEVYYRDQADRR
jgi:tRNA pseudouridine38-40 synthase